jgi:hypothetical protein
MARTRCPRLTGFAVLDAAGCAAGDPGATCAGCAAGIASSARSALPHKEIPAPAADPGADRSITVTWWPAR